MGCAYKTTYMFKSSCYIPLSYVRCTNIKYIATFVSGTFWGDPHVRTLDEKTFIFNGLGEYTLLQIRTDNVTFDLQARTERAIKADGSLSEATVFSAFAAQDDTSSFHCELNRESDGKYLIKQ